MGGKAATTNPFTIGRANVLIVLNLTQDSDYVQFSSVHKCEFSLKFARPERTAVKVNFQNTEVMGRFNGLFALTPPRSVAIISVSVRSAELRLGLYV